MKISVVGAGNVGSLAAMRIAQEGLGEVFLVDIVKGLAKGKAYDMEDARQILRNNYSICGTDNIDEIKDSGIVVVTAGLARKPGMTREDLFVKNAAILSEISQKIKKLAAGSTVIVVTNPLDLMTYLVLKVTGFKSSCVFGMGLTLDAARFSNLISKELNIPNTEIEACVIGSHGEGMLPLPQFTKVKGSALSGYLDARKIETLVSRTTARGAEIVSLLGSGSAFFAPSAAIAEIVKAIVADEKKVLGVSVLLNGEYGINDVSIGVPVRMGHKGIEEVIELNLGEEEKNKLKASAENIRSFRKLLPIN